MYAWICTKDPLESPTPPHNGGGGGEGEGGGGKSSLHKGNQDKTSTQHHSVMSQRMDVKSVE